jgi:hypothetical protein
LFIGSFLRNLEIKLRKKGFVQEANRCLNILNKIAKNPVEIEPYGSVNQPMESLSFMEEECDHSLDADDAGQCPVCGKKAD